jgi:2-oxo-3-hexenedioate decarboxylase/2-keto-4-pentenoate hydratase
VSASEQTAAAIADARLTHTRIGVLPPDRRPDTPLAGYVVQDAVHARLASRLGRLVGWKIGCTTAVMQRMLAIPSPCYGGMLRSGVHHGAARLRHTDYCRPGIECEIAVRLGADLPALGAPYTGGTVAPLVAGCTVAIELVDDRYTDFHAVGVATLIADDFFHSGCVLGPEPADWRSLDLTSLAGRTLINGVERGRGRGGDVMGHPFNAVAWLANALLARGQHLREGQIVLSGSVVETQWVTPGDACVADIGPLGSVSVSFE